MMMKQMKTKSAAISKLIVLIAAAAVVTTATGLQPAADDDAAGVVASPDRPIRLRGPPGERPWGRNSTFNHTAMRGRMQQDWEALKNDIRNLEVDLDSADMQELKDAIDARSPHTRTATNNCSSVAGWTFALGVLIGMVAQLAGMNAYTYIRGLKHQRSKEVMDSVQMQSVQFPTE